MIDQRCRWIDIASVACVFWIVGLRHMDRYLLSPRGMDCTLADYVSYGLLAVNFYLSGLLSWSSYQSKQVVSEKQYSFSWIKKRIIRFYPLFFVSVFSLYLASLLMDGINISFFQFLVTSVGLSWLFPPMIPTLCFCSILLFFITLTALLFLVSKEVIRKILVLVIYLILIIGFTVTHHIDHRIILFYPFYFWFVL